MGASSKSFLVALDSCGPLPLWIKTLEAQQSKKRRPEWRKNRVTMMRRSRRFLMKKRAPLEASRRPRNALKKKVRTLRKLVPSSGPVGLDGLFREAADHIMSLQLKVKLMQDLVDLLSGSDE